MNRSFGYIGMGALLLACLACGGNAGEGGTGRAATTGAPPPAATQPPEPDRARSDSLPELPPNWSAQSASWPDACRLTSDDEVASVVSGASNVTHSGSSGKYDTWVNDSCAYHVTFADDRKLAFAVTLDPLDSWPVTLSNWVARRSRSVTEKPDLAFDLTFELGVPAYRDMSLMFSKGGYFVIIGSGRYPEFNGGERPTRDQVLGSTAFALARAIVDRLPSSPAPTTRRQERVVDLRSGDCVAIEGPNGVGDPRTLEEVPCDGKGSRQPDHRVVEVTADVCPTGTDRSVELQPADADIARGARLEFVCLRQIPRGQRPSR